MRIDKWLWAVRLFKTRNQASDACRTGKVTLDETGVKPSREVKRGERITIRYPRLTRTIEVLDLPLNRVGAALVTHFLKDLTPQEEYDKLKNNKQVQFEYRQQGSGRPTKRDRRRIEYLKKIVGE